MAAHPAAEVLANLLKPTPVVAGSNWFTNFDAPIKGTDGKFRVGAGSLGTVRGGHCYCLEPVGEPDKEVAWIFYDQGEEGACEGFGNSRAMTLMAQGVLFDAFWLYDDARRVEDTFPSGEGSTNRAAAEALKKWGDHRESGVKPDGVITRQPWHLGVSAMPIKSFHWATSVEEIRQALGYGPEVSEFPFLNSWGKDDYEHRVYMPDTVIDTLLQQGAEYTILMP